MKKIKLIKGNEIAIHQEDNDCDFCGESSYDVFTSSYDDCSDSRKCEFQICKNCVTQLFKLIK